MTEVVVGDVGARWFQWQWNQWSLDIFWKMFSVCVWCPGPPRASVSLRTDLKSINLVSCAVIHADKIVSGQGGLGSRFLVRGCSEVSCGWWLVSWDWALSVLQGLEFVCLLSMVRFSLLAFVLYIFEYVRRRIRGSWDGSAWEGFQGVLVQVYRMENGKWEMDAACYRISSGWCYFPRRLVVAT